MRLSWKLALLIKKSVYMNKIILFRIIHARYQTILDNALVISHLSLFMAPWKSCHYVELDPVETHITKTSTAFLKGGKYLESEKFLVTLSELMLKFIFSELKLFLAKLFWKRLNSILSIYLHFSRRCMRQIKC